MRAVVSFFFAPWWVIAIIALGIFGLGEFYHRSLVADHAEQREALTRPMPDAVDLSDFTRERDIGLADETHVSGWIDFDLNYHLVKQKSNGTVKGERWMYVLFGAQDTFEDRQARAVMVLTESEKERLIDGLVDFMDLDRTFAFLDADQPTDTGRSYYAFNGEAGKTHSYDDLVEDALADEGVSPSSEMIYILPYFDGRVAALTPTRSPDVDRQVFHMITGVVLAFAALKLAFRLLLRRGTGQPGRRARGEGIFDGSPIASGRPERDTLTTGAVQSRAARPIGRAGGDPIARMQTKFHAPEETVADTPPKTAKTPDLIARIQASSGARKGLIYLAGGLFLIWSAPWLLGPILSFGILFLVYGKAVKGVTSAISDLGAALSGKAANARPDPFDRLR